MPCVRFEGAETAEDEMVRCSVGDGQHRHCEQQQASYDFPAYFHRGRSIASVSVRVPVLPGSVISGKAN